MREEGETQRYYRTLGHVKAQRPHKWGRWLPERKEKNTPGELNTEHLWVLGGCFYLVFLCKVFLRKVFCCVLKIVFRD
jgi:hypothetical protein